MEIEEEIARTLSEVESDGMKAKDFMEQDTLQDLAAALVPVVRRAQAEAWFEGADAAVHGYDLPDASQIHNPYIEQEVEHD